MASIIDIEGIGPKYKEILTEAGIKTTEKLLEVAASKKGRQTVAEDTGVSEKLILEWVNRADLMRIKGVGEEFSDLLEVCGVDSPAELAHRNAANLHAKMEEVNAERNLVRRLPTADQVQEYIDQCKTMEKVVTH